MSQGVVHVLKVQHAASLDCVFGLLLVYPENGAIWHDYSVTPAFTFWLMWPTRGQVVLTPERIR